MREIIYSQKQHIAYTNPTTFTREREASHQSNITVSKKSVVTMKRLQHSIALNTTQSNKPSRELNFYNFSNENQNNTTLINSITTNIRKSNNPTRKPNNDRVLINHFIDEYKKIISNLNAYHQYYELVLNQEIDRHNQYFTDLIKVIQTEKRKSQNYLRQQIQSLSQKIQLQKALLHSKISLLDKHNLLPHDKQRQELNYQQFIQVPIFRIQLTKLDKFKEEVKKFLFDVTTEQDLQKELSEQNSVINDTICLEQSIKTEKKERTPLEDITALEIQQMTPIHHQPEQIIHPIKPSSGLQDKDLYCDEDIENILKENKIVRKRRYECRQEPIPQESESHEDSGIMSNVDNNN